DSAALAVPGDEWLAGQRVRYLLQSGRSADELLAARACRAPIWWCQALTGLAWHVAGDFASADSVYRDALDAMPPDERCRWTDIAPLLDAPLARRYRRLPCDERGALEQRVWWLAQPLYSLPGNDRRTEHLARATMAQIEGDARSTYGVPWGDDLREVTLRFGWPSYWTQGEPRTFSGFVDPPITGHEPQPAFHFLPDASALDDPASASPQVWEPHAPRAREHRARGSSAAPRRPSAVRRASASRARPRGRVIRFRHPAVRSSRLLADPARGRAALRAGFDRDAPACARRTVLGGLGARFGG